MVKTCTVCAITRALPYHYPKQPELPLERMQAQKPFNATGVDLCGPFEVRQGYDRIKIWVCLFSCLTTRAVYLVQVKSLSALTFLDALWELSCRRGQPSFLYSDNATNFTKTAKFLEQMAEEAKVQQELQKRAITWEFVTPHAPWKGGNYERLIKLTKQGLEKMGVQYIFTENEFKMNLLEVERVLNNRPLVKVGEIEVITPAHFLGQGAPNSDKDFTGVDRAKIKALALTEQNNLPHLFIQSQEKITNFWKALWDQYLSDLRFSRDRRGNKYKKNTKGWRYLHCMAR